MADGKPEKEEEEEEEELVGNAAETHRQKSSRIHHQSWVKLAETSKQTDSMEMPKINLAPLRLKTAPKISNPSTGKRANCKQKKATGQRERETSIDRVKIGIVSTWLFDWVWCVLPAVTLNAEFRQRAYSIQLYSIALPFLLFISLYYVCVFLSFFLIGRRALRTGFSSRTGKLSTLTLSRMSKSTSRRASLSKTSFIFFYCYKL